MSQISYRFIAPLPTLTYQSVRVVQGDGLQVAVGKLQGQIDALQAAIKLLQDSARLKLGRDGAPYWKLGLNGTSTKRLARM